jgi:hypothetical protein
MKTLHVEIDVEGPILTASLESSAFGIDVGFLRSFDGRLIMPGTLIKGVIRELLEDMSAAAPPLLSEEDVNSWLGAQSADARDPEPMDAFVPHRGLVTFSDFELSESVGKNPITRVQVADDTGSVEHGMLAVLEAPVPPGASATLTGAITIDADQGAAKRIEEWIGKALRLVPAIGGMKGAGFGHILNVRVSDRGERKVIPPLAKAIAADPNALQRSGSDRVRIALIFEEPFLVASEAISGNLFKSSTIVPGGAIKGAVATRLERVGSLGRLAASLDKTIFLHAKPTTFIEKSKLGPRPRATPLSLYSLESLDGSASRFDGLVDALVEDPGEYACGGWFIQFSGNWKNDGESGNQAGQLYGHVFEPSFDVRTRTAIGPRGAAATSQLFTQMSVVPGKGVWISEVIRGTSSKEDFIEILGLLVEHPLEIGKTCTPAHVIILEPGNDRLAVPLQRFADEGMTAWRIVLETDAQLHGPDDVFRYSDVLDPRERLTLQYRDYFTGAVNTRLPDQVSPLQPEDASLRIYAGQRWAGGYQALRFPNYSDRYYPHLVTEAGSVFEISLPARADAAVESFVARGLPLPASVPTKPFEHERSPFVPENGYGEVSIEARPLTTSPFDEGSK